LMMLQQTMLSIDKNVELKTSSESIQLGSFESLVNKQDIKNKMSFSIQYNSNHVATDFVYKHSYPMIFGNSDKRKIDLRYRFFNGMSFLDEYKFSCNDKAGEKVSFKLNNPTTISGG
jgi:hypothetical protein